MQPLNVAPTMQVPGSSRFLVFYSAEKSVASSFNAMLQGLIQRTCRQGCTLLDLLLWLLRLRSSFDANIGLELLEVQHGDFFFSS